MATFEKVLRGIFYFLVGICLVLFGFIAIVAPFKIEGWQGPVVSAMAMTPHIVVTAYLLRRRWRR